MSIKQETGNPNWNVAGHELMHILITDTIHSVYFLEQRHSQII